MIRACGHRGRGRQARRRRDRQGSPSQSGHPGCLECPLINMWKWLFSSCFGNMDSDSEDAVGGGWLTEQEDERAGDEAGPIGGVSGAASSVSSSLGANGGTGDNGPHSGGAVSTAGVGYGGGGSVSPAETKTAGAAAATNKISGRAVPRENGVPAPALASSSFVAMSPSAAASPPTQKIKSSLRATAPEWRPAAPSVPALVAAGVGAVPRSSALPPNCAPQPFRKGDEVFYIRGSDPPLEGVIQKVHAEEYPPYYTVFIFVTGREKNTDAAHLRHKKEGNEGVTNGRGHLNGQQQAGPDAFASLGADAWGNTSRGATAVAAAPVRQQAGPQQPPVAPQQAGSHHATKQPVLGEGHEATPSAGVGMAGGGGNTFRGIERPGLTAETWISTGATEQTGGNPFDML